MTTMTSLHRDAFGRLVCVDAEGVEHIGVVPVRSFPITAPGEGLSLVNTDGHEVVWLDSWEGLPAATRAMIEADLQVREFMPRILKILDVSSFATPSTWTLETDRGPAELVLKGEEDIRRLPGTALLIADRHGVHYLLPAPADLDRHSRRLLDRFL